MVVLSIILVFWNPCDSLCVWNFSDNTDSWPHLGSWSRDTSFWLIELVFEILNWNSFCDLNFSNIRLLAAFVVLVEGNQRTRWRFWQPHSQQRWGFLLFTWTWPYLFTWTWQYFFAWTWQYFLPGPDNTFYLADRIIKCCIQFWVENPCYTRNILL